MIVVMTSPSLIVCNYARALKERTPPRNARITSAEVMPHQEILRFVSL
jgi:hypothetical protein